MKTLTKILLAALWLATHPLFAQTSAFTYQGRLNDNGSPANGTYDLRFTIYDADTGNGLQGGPLTNAPTTVSNGTFTVLLNFGSSPFNGADRWMEIGVRTNGSVSAYQTLTPRQQITSTPYAVRAINAGNAAVLSGTLAASQVTGTLALSQIPSVVLTNNASGVNLTGNFSGNGAGVTNILIGSLASANLSYSSVVAWGVNVGNNGQTSVPAGLTNVMAVGGGQYHSLALKSNGTLVAWGTNTFGFGQTNVPAGLSNVVSISVGHSFNLALKNNGTVVAWGSNYATETNVPPGLNNVTAVAAGAIFSMALKNDGTVVVWGSNSQGQTNVPSGLSNVTAVAAGYSHDLALKSNGTVIAWGDNSLGQTNVPSGLSNVVAIAGGYGHNLALKSDGTVVAWGYNSNGQTNVPSGLSNVVAVTAGAYCSLALKSDGTVVGWGDLAAGGTPPPGLKAIVVGAGCAALHVLAIQRFALPDTFNGSFQVSSNLQANTVSSGDGSFTGRVGIGTTNPATQLHVASSGDAEISIQSTEAANHRWTLQSGASGDFQIIDRTLEASRMTIQTNGNLLIPGSITTVGTFNGNGSGLTGLTASQIPNLDASKIASGTLSDAQLSTNVAFLNGTNVFGGTNRFTGTAILTNANNQFSGNGNGLTSLNASNLAGTIADGRLSSNVALLNSNQTFSGVNTLSNSANVIAGNGSGLTSLNGSNISSGTVADSRLSGNVAFLNGNQTFSGTNTLSNPANSFTGNGGGLTSLNASNLSSGTVADGRLSTNVALLNASQIFTGQNTFTNSVNGGGVTLDASEVSGGFNLKGTNGIRSTLGLAKNSGAYSLDAGPGDTVLRATSGKLLLQTGSGASAISIATNNYVGMGIANPSTALHVYSYGDTEFSLQSIDGGRRWTLQSSGTGTPGLTGSLQIIDRTAGASRLLIDTNGNVGIGVSGPTNKLQVNGGITCTALVQTSDRNAKEKFEPISSAEILEKLLALPISRWNFKQMNDGRHLGPMAQDFYAAFGLGRGETTITAIDADGVALAAIQGLNQKVDTKTQNSEERIKKLEAENAELKAKTSKLETLEKRLADLEKIIQTQSK